MMAVRAKFFVKSILHMSAYAPGEVCAEIKLAPVNDGENVDWSKWTPSGEIAMTITNPDAIEKFELGGQYFVDFTPAT